MANKDALQNLTRFDPIVNPDGTPTEFFMRILQGSNGITGDITTDVENLKSINIETDAPINGGPYPFGDHEEGDPPLTIGHDTSLVVPGTYGDATHSPQITVDEFGHVQEITDIPISGGGGGASLYPVNALPGTLTTWVNQGSSTATVNADGTITLKAALDGTDQIRGLFMPLPTPPYAYKIGFLPSLSGVDFQQAGIALRDSVSGKLTLFGVYRDTTLRIWSSMNYNSPTSKNANVLTPNNNAFANSPVYVSISDDGVTKKVSLGWDPNQQPFLNYSVPRTTFLTADQIGIFTENLNTTTPLVATFFSWV